jgi:Zn-finger nucleic acid-binding protein
MNCPVDGTTLLLSERQNVEIDYCPACRGVWLDRGELDKLLQRDHDRDDGDRDRQRVEARPAAPPKKKKGWLSDLFEFGE